MLRHTLLEHRIRQGLDHPQAVDAPIDPQGQALARVLVNERQNAQAAAIMGLAFYKVETPDMVGPLGPQPDAGSVIEPQPTAWSVLLGNLEPLATPDALNPVLAHTPACDLQKSGDPAIAIAPVLRGKDRDGSGEGILVSPDGRDVTLCPAWLADDPAGVALREAVLLSNALNRLPTPFGA
jgi:hypothetical protein